MMHVYVQHTVIQRDTVRVEFGKQKAAGIVYLRAGAPTFGYGGHVCRGFCVRFLSFYQSNPVTVNGGAHSTKGGTASRTVGLSWQRAARAISCRGLSVRTHTLLGTGFAKTPGLSPFH